ncbi:hypothetical protein BDZ89DRAFT_1079589, partial [Hymenopellis radicata]
MSARLVDTLPLSRGGDTGNMKLWIAAPTQTHLPSRPPIPNIFARCLVSIAHPRTWRAHLSHFVTR